MRNRSVSLSLNGATLALLALLLVTFVAFLGMVLFNTKGEPREAIVAVSMLEQGNWILPVSCGADLPYKPPMLAWCIAVLGWLNGGHVTEFLARLPSGLAATAMLLMVFRFFARRESPAVALVTVLVTATTFEFHRSATSCRVDMLLTAFIVMAIMTMYTQWERHPESKWRLPWWGILLMSGGVLTKGPVGMLLPCGTLLLLRLLKGDNFWRAFLQLTVAGLLALVIPAVWYYAAWLQGGESFLQLAFEENFGRFAGKMSYESHEHTFFYNFQTLFTGIAPYTLLLLGALAAWRKFPPVKGRMADFWKDLRAMKGHALLAVSASLVIFVFYCIPKSKRSTYLLPMYPFLVYWIAVMIRWLVRKAPRVLRVYGIFMAVTGAVASLLILLAMCGVFDGFASGKAGVYIAEIHSLGIVSVMMSCLCLGGCIGSMRVLCGGAPSSVVQWTVLDTLFIYWMFSAAIQPAVLNPKSDRPFATAVEAITGPDVPVYGFVSAHMLRYYTAGFYMDDQVKAITETPVDLPDNSWIIAGERDVDSLKKVLPAQATLTPVLQWPQKSCDTKQLPALYTLSLK